MLMVMAQSNTLTQAVKHLTIRQTTAQASVSLGVKVWDLIVTILTTSLKSAHGSGAMSTVLAVFQIQHPPHLTQTSASVLQTVPLAVMETLERELMQGLEPELMKALKQELMQALKQELIVQTTTVQLPPGLVAVDKRINVSMGRRQTRTETLSASTLYST